MNRTTGNCEYWLLCKLAMDDPDSEKIFIKNVDIDQPDRAIDKS